MIANLFFFFIFLPCFRRGCGAVQVPNPQFVMHTLIWIHFFQRSTQLLHLVTPLHLALTILPPSSTLPFASPFSLLAPMAFYAFSAPTSFFLAFCLPTLKDSSLDLFPHGILLITHAHHQPVVPAEHKGTRNLHMPPGASETYIETLRFSMQYL